MIDPLLPHGARPAPSGAVRPAPHRRALRLAGAAGMGSLLMLTGYVTANATQSNGTGTADATDTADTTAATTATTTPATADTTATTAAAAVDTTAATSTTLAACTNTYTVVAGDSWTGIASEASVVVDVLYTINGTSADTVIHPGDLVCLPDGVTVVVTTPATTASTVEATTTTAAPATTAAPVTTSAPVTTAAAPAQPAAQPSSSSKGSS